MTILLMAFAIGCKKDPAIEQNPTPTLKTGTAGDEEPEGTTVLGAQLENAYSLENMSAAYAALRNNSGLSSSLNLSVSIQPTHLYIRFLPQDSSDLTYLIDKSGFELFDFPLDYAIEKLGFYYHDPGIPAGEATYLYTVIPIEKADGIPIKYELLEKCFIPDEDRLAANGKNESYIETAKKIELESLMMTRNITPDEYNEGLALIASKARHTPKGYIRVVNTPSENWEGVKKVKVRTWNGLRFGVTYTNEDGYYEMPLSYLTKNTHYAVIFENQTGFAVWGNLGPIAPANYGLGIHASTGHTRNIGTNSDAWIWATINNATYIYREKMCPYFSINQPVSNLRIWSLNMGGALGCAPMARRFPLEVSTLGSFLTTLSIENLTGVGLALVMPDIFIFKKFNHNTQSAYSTVFHELSHASHYEKAGKDYWRNYILGIVSNGVNNCYGNGSGNKDGYIGVGEMWGYYFGWECMKKHFGTSGSPQGAGHWFKPIIMSQLHEAPCNLTVKQIFDCLTSDVTNHTQFKNKLISKYGNATQITKVFTDNNF